MGRTLAWTLGLGLGAVGAVVALWWGAGAADVDPPVIAVGPLVAGGGLDGRAWRAAVATDGYALKRVGVEVTCAGHSPFRTTLPARSARSAPFRDLIDVDTLRARLRNGRCDIRLLAWDRNPWRGPVVAVQSVFVYADGPVVDAGVVDSDGVPPAVDGLAAVAADLRHWDEVIVHDGGSGVREVTVTVTCGEWSTRASARITELATRTSAASAMRDPAAVLAASGVRGRCVLQVDASDHAGNRAPTAVLDLYRYDNGVALARALGADGAAPDLQGLDGADLRESLVVIDDIAGIARVELAVRCSGEGTPRAADFGRWTGRARLDELWPRILAPGPCELVVTATDHASNTARWTAPVLVGHDGVVRRRPAPSSQARPAPGPSVDRSPGADDHAVPAPERPRAQDARPGIQIECRGSTGTRRPRSRSRVPHVDVTPTIGPCRVRILAGDRRAAERHTTRRAGR